MKFPMLFFACLTPAAAAITGVSVQGATATQAIVRFTAPDNGACTVEVSESASFAPLVHDVDPSLFPGSNLDSRTESASSGRERAFVIGKRRAENALNGKWYSRALQAYTPHYYRITCGADQAAGSFSTTNIVLGNTYNEPLPPDPSVVGSTIFSSTGRYAYPQFTKWDVSDPTARPETIIDPQTGAALKRFYLPGDQNTGNAPAGDHSIVSGSAYGTNWTNPNNAFADDSASATYSAANRDWLVLPVSIRLDNLQSLEVDLKAWCTGTCTDPIQVGLSVNGVNAWPADATAALVERVLGTTALPSSFTAFGGASYVMGDWTPAGLDSLHATDLNSRTGRVDVDGSGNVTWDSGDWFYPGWIAGSRITINNLVCTLTGLTNPKRLAIDPASCPLSLPASNQIYIANNFALMVRKKTANADTIGVQYAKYNLTQAVAPGWSSSGSPHFCSNNLTRNVATGDYGYHCVYPSNLPMVYWISATDASANYLGFLTSGYLGGADGWDNNSCNNDSTTLRASGTANQERFNCIISDHTGNAIVLGCTLDSTNASGNLSISCINLTVGSAGRDLGSLAANFTAGHGTLSDRSKFGCGISGIQNAQLMINCRRSIQDTISWVLVFDPAKISSAAGCTGAGLPGCVIAAQSTWAGPLPARWCVLHTLFSSGDGATNIAWVAGKYINNPGFAGGGPYLSNITSAALTSNPGIAAGTGACPAGSLGCDNITVDGEPCNSTPAAGEGANGTCAKDNAQEGLQAAAVGDVVDITPGPLERFKIVSKTDATHWMVQRAFGPPLQGGPVTKDHTGVGPLSMKEMCLSDPFSPTYDWSSPSWTWDFAADPHGDNVGGAAVKIIPFEASHPVPMQNGVIGDGTYPISTNILSTPAMFVAQAAPFAGITGLTLAVEIAQTHPNHSQDTAPASEQSWFLDARPLSGPGDSAVDAFTHVSGQLYKVSNIAVPVGDKDNFTNITWGGGSGGNRTLSRKLQPTMAMSGTQPMVDISSAATGNVIGDTSADSYKYCVVRFVNECRTGSAVGEAYLNAPYIKPRGDGTYGSELAFGSQEAALQNDLCIFNSDAYLNAIVQLGYQAGDAVGALGRVLTKGLMRYRLSDVNMNVKAMPNASYVNIEGGMMVKLPPFPATDTVNRRTFVPMMLQLSPPAALGADNAVVEFGYAENGAVDRFYCTSRHESCLAVSAAVQDDPFKFPSDGADGTAAGVTGVACASGCSVAIPAIPQHLVYYSVQYRDSGNRVIAQTPLQVAAVP